MSETSLTTNNPLLPEQVQDMQKLPALLETYLPKMGKYKARALAVLDTIGPINEDGEEEMEDAISKLAAVRDVYNANNKMRMEMTSITDAFKDMVMEFERDLDPKTGAKSKYNEKKKFLEEAQQRKQDKIEKERQAQAKRKEVENFKVDLRAKMLENLTNLLTNGVKKVDSGSKDFFDAATLEDFDARANTYKSNKPKLKQSDYDACFVQPFPSGTKEDQLIPPGDYKRFVEEVQQEETYDKWNTQFVEKISPIINEWRAKIPDLKKQKQEVAELAKKSQADADALKKKQDEEAATKQQERQAELDAQAQQAQDKIAKEADIEKTMNNFAEQGVNQNLGDPGKVKLILKFSDPKKAPKAFLEIIYQSMANADFATNFPVFQKRDKSKKLMVDEKNRPVYIDAVQWWIDWWLDNCNGTVDGTEIHKDSKVTIRK
jgi:predicted transcriptional regulator